MKLLSAQPVVLCFTPLVEDQTDLIEGTFFDSTDRLEPIFFASVGPL